MKAVIQRVKYASVTVDQQLINKIDQGFLLLVGFQPNDKKEDLIKVANKISGLRIFEDENGKMNLSLSDIKGEILSVSQFTLYADCKHGKRPSFTGAAKAEDAKELYHQFNQILKDFNLNVKEGVFQADMKVELLNDGPVTIILESEDL